MIDLNKYVIEPEPHKPFHSNGYAHVASGGHVGSVSPVSFGDRQKIEHSRGSVGSYNRSIIGSTYGVVRAKSVEPGLPVLPSRGAIGQVSARGPIGSPGRTYNPYA